MQQLLIFPSHICIATDPLAYSKMVMVDIPLLTQLVKIKFYFLSNHTACIYIMMSSDIAHADSMFSFEVKMFKIVKFR